MFSLFRDRLRPFALLVPLAVLVLTTGCRRSVAPENPEVKVPPSRPREAVKVPPAAFTDVTEKAGVHFVHTNGSFGKKLLPETMGPGVAFFDYDNDDKPDLLFVNSCYWPGHEKEGERPTLKLYRNRGDGAFAEVTEEAGLAVTMYGMGVTTGDYDNDGWTDLFITGVGGNRLFHNEPLDAKTQELGRRFREVTAEAGVAGPGGWPRTPVSDFLKHTEPLTWSSSSAFLDYDGDADLDLFVCNYITWSPAIDIQLDFRLTGLGRAFGPPSAFKGSQCFLYENEGGGKFHHVAVQAGVHVSEREGTDEKARLRDVGKSLGVMVADVDRDGWPDIFVANDTVRNFFFHNIPAPDGGRRFEEIGVFAGVAYAEGKARGAMGIDWAPSYRPEQSALLIGNFSNEPNTFLSLENRRRCEFSDLALAEGIAGPSREPLKFGVFFFDYDLDQRPDFLTVNGHLEPEISQVQRGQTFAQPVQLFWNTGTQPRGFEPVPETADNADLFRPLVGRAGAFADFDGDGDLDVVLTANGGPARLVRNDRANENHWIRLRLRGDGKRSNRSAIGARVVLEAGGITQEKEVVSARGYLSQSEMVLTFGLGKVDKVDRVTIHWPGREAGPPQVLTDLAIDREHRVEQK
jgi:hypothetical protein